MSKTIEIRIAGFGGQGIILAGYILGKAASIYDNKHATLIQSFGPEARGSACSAQLIISDEAILYPYIIQPSLSVMLSRDAYEIYHKEITSGGIMIIEEDLVQPVKDLKDVKQYAIPATRLAEELGRKIVMNIITVGFFAAVTRIISYEATKQAVESSVPKGTEAMNLKAFDTGYQFGAELIGRTEESKQKPKKKTVNKQR
jgi:2-oxoglutarate ferredoxin oxidoreductase subunit gamma